MAVGVECWRRQLRLSPAESITESEGPAPCVALVQALPPGSTLTLFNSHLETWDLLGACAELLTHAGTCSAAFAVHCFRCARRSSATVASRPPARHQPCLHIAACLPGLCAGDMIRAARLQNLFLQPVLGDPRSRPSMAQLVDVRQFTAALILCDPAWHRAAAAAPFLTGPAAPSEGASSLGMGVTAAGAGAPRSSSFAVQGVQAGTLADALRMDAAVLGVQLNIRMLLQVGAGLLAGSVSAAGGLSTGCAAWVACVAWGVSLRADVVFRSVQQVARPATQPPGILQAAGCPDINIVTEKLTQTGRTTRFEDTNHLPLGEQEEQ